MKISISQILELKLMPPGERYTRFAESAPAGRFACALASIPGVGAAVYSGGRFAPEGIVVTMLDDTAAADAAGCGTLRYSLNPPRGESLR